MAMGRTNCVSESAGTYNEITLPAQLGSISATTGERSVTLNLSYTSTSYVSGVEVRYKTSGYPSSSTDGSGKTVTGAPSSIAVTGLTNETTYYFRVFLYREVNGIKYFQTSTVNAQITGKPSGFTISGIRLAAKTNTYVVIDRSGNFTMTIPTGYNATVYLIGGGENGEYGNDGTDDYDGNGNSYYGRGGDGGAGGKFLKAVISPGTYNCSSIIGAGYNFNATASDTSLSVAGKTYSTAAENYTGTRGDGAVVDSYDENYPIIPSKGSEGINTPYGIIGSGGGGGGGGSGWESARDRFGCPGGTGAGCGGDGGYNQARSTAGADATGYGCGGGGGGGGYDCSPYSAGGAGGLGKAGCIIIAWTA